MSQGWACDLQTEHAVTWKSWVGRCGDVKVNNVHLETISRQYPYCENETIFIWGHLPSVGAEHTQWSAVTCRPPHLFPSLKLSLQTACDFPQGSNLLPSMRPPVAVFQQPYHPMTRWPQHVIQKNNVCKKKKRYHWTRLYRMTRKSFFHLSDGVTNTNQWTSWMESSAVECLSRTHRPSPNPCTNWIILVLLAFPNLKSG